MNSLRVFPSVRYDLPGISLNDAECRETAEDFLRSLRGRMAFDVGLIFLENEKDHRLYLLGHLVEGGLSRPLQRAISSWNISRDSLFLFADEGLQHTPGIKPYLDKLGVAYCSYQVVNVEGGRAVLVLLGDRWIDRREERLLANFSALCHQMAENLGSTIYRRREARRRRQLKAIVEISRIVAETYELSQLMERTLSAINDYFQTRLSYVLLYEEGDRERVRSISMEIDGKLLHLDAEMRNLLLNFARERGMHPLAQNMDALGKGNVEVSLPIIEVPIVVDGKLAGVIKCSLQDYLEVDELDMEFLNALANQLGAGVKNVFNYRKLREKSDILSRLNRIMHRLNELLDGEEIIRFLVEELREFTGAEKVLFLEPFSSSPWKPSTPGEEYEVWSDYLFVHWNKLGGFHDNLIHLRGGEEAADGDVPGETPLPEGWEAVLLSLGIEEKTPGFLLLLFTPERRPYIDYLRQILPPLAGNIASALRRVGYYREALWERGKLEAVFNTMRDAVLVMDEECRILAANREAERLFSISRKGRMGAPVRGSLGIRALEDYVEEGFRADDDGEREMLLPLNPPKPVKMYRARVLLPGGKRLGQLVVLRDITHEKQLDQLKESFLSCVSHELNTPLAIIIGYTEILREGWHLHSDDLKRQYIDSIKRSSERLHRVIADILLATKISRGRLELDLRPCLLEQVARDMVDQYRMIDRNHRYRLMIRHEKCRCEMDEVKIRRVVWNLIDNAKKFSPAGTTIEVVVGKRRNKVFLAVKDQGIGISPWHLPSVFSKFSQVDNGDSRRSCGLGIGLYLAKEIVSRHGGDIEVHSEPERGSTFTLVLPGKNLYCRESKGVTD